MLSPAVIVMSLSADSRISCFAVKPRSVVEASTITLPPLTVVVAAVAVSLQLIPTFVLTAP